VPRGNDGHQACRSVRVADGVTVGATRPATHGDSLDYIGVRGRHQKCKRKRKLSAAQVQPRESSVGTGGQKVAMANTAAAAMSPANHDEPTGTLSDVDPSMLPLRFDVGQAGRDVADDPMVVELIGSLHVIRITIVPALVVGSPRHVDAAFLEDKRPRPLTSPRHSCGPPLVDELPCGFRDGTVCTVKIKG
jgi:hypothetical protein